MADTSMEKHASTPWFDEDDEKIFSKFENIGDKIIPPKAEFLKHLENYTNGQEVKLQWHCIGRRPPTPENVETNELEDDQFTQVENTIDDYEREFEFEDDPKLHVSLVRKNATPKSAKKSKTSFQSILLNYARHHKIDMKGTEEELRNKVKQQQEQLQLQLQENNSNQHQMLGDENLSQSSESQTLQDSNLDLQNNEIESSSNSQLNEPLENQFSNKNESSLDESLQSHLNEAADSTNSNHKLESQTSSSAMSESIATSSQNQSNTQQLQFFHSLPQTSNLNFQNILNRTSDPNADLSSSFKSLMFSNGQDSIQNKSSPSSMADDSEPNLVNTTSTETQQTQSTLSEIITSTGSSFVTSQSQSIMNEEHHSSSQGEFNTDLKNSEENMECTAEMLGSDLPLPEESKQDLSEFDFQMDE